MWKTDRHGGTLHLWLLSLVVRDVCGEHCAGNAFVVCMNLLERAEILFFLLQFLQHCELVHYFITHRCYSFLSIPIGLVVPHGLHCAYGMHTS